MAEGEEVLKSLLMKVKEGSAKERKGKLLSRVRLFMTPWIVAYQTPTFMGFSRQDTRVGCHFLHQKIFPTQGLNPGLPHCRQTLYRLSHLRDN